MRDRLGKEQTDKVPFKMLIKPPREIRKWVYLCGSPNNLPSPVTKREGLQCRCTTGENWKHGREVTGSTKEVTPSLTKYGLEEKHDLIFCVRTTNWNRHKARPRAQGLRPAQSALANSEMSIETLCCKRTNKKLHCLNNRVTHSKET